MATYAIGDVQGCFDELQALLNAFHFNVETDRLWFTGDLVNRGSKSLQVLRFVKNLPSSSIVVLGNHDLHLLAVANGIEPKTEKDTFDDVLTAQDREELCDWLRKQPLFYHDELSGYALVHAGLPPQWNLEKAQQCAEEIENTLRADNFVEFLQHMYGNKPDVWREELVGLDRLRFICNSFTRIRFCDSNGRLNLESKGGLNSQPEGLVPWFKVPNRASKNVKIIFGHWAALEGKTHEPNTYALDTGCVWGKCLSAMRLEDLKIFSVPCKEN